MLQILMDRKPMHPDFVKIYILVAFSAYLHYIFIFYTINGKYRQILVGISLFL